MRDGDAGDGQIEWLDEWIVARDEREMPGRLLDDRRRTQRDQFENVGGAGIWHKREEERYSGLARDDARIAVRLLAIE